MLKAMPVPYQALCTSDGPQAANTYFKIPRPSFLIYRTPGRQGRGPRPHEREAA